MSLNRRNPRKRVGKSNNGGFKMKTKQLEKSRKERIIRLTESQSHIALLTIVDIITDKNNCDIDAFGKAITIAESY